jgi:hypothetical protein
MAPILKLNTKDTNMKIRDYYSQELRDFAADFLEFDFKNGERRVEVGKRLELGLEVLILMHEMESSTGRSGSTVSCT